MIGRICSLLTVVVVVLPLSPLAVAIEQPPNIVFVLADDLGWADVGYNGAKFYETPHIDQLASDGMRFNRFYPGGPNCAPTRACLMTGMYTPRHHLYQPGGRAKGDVAKMRWKVPTVGQGQEYLTFQSNRDRINGKWTSVAEVLNAAGYATARIGKWHLGNDDQGFGFSSNDGINPFGPGHRGSFYGDVNVGKQLTNRALQFIDEHRDEPFFLYVAHWEVHTPIQAKQDLVRKYQEKLKQAEFNSLEINPTYAAEIEVVDRSVGRLRQKLSELGLAENTIFIFSSDNGGLPAITSNAPLYAGKGSLFEGGIRTPFVATWPEHIKPGTANDTPVTGVDFLPTATELAGAKLPTSQPVDGVSIVPLLKGESIAERPIFWHYPLYLSGGKGNRVLPVYGADELYWRAVPSTAVMQGDWKLIYYYEYGNYKLFNLKDDIGEQHDLAQSHADQAKALHDTLKEWVSSTKAPVPNIANPAFATADGG